MTDRVDTLSPGFGPAASVSDVDEKKLDAEASTSGIAAADHQDQIDVEVLDAEKGDYVITELTEAEQEAFLE